MGNSLLETSLRALNSAVTTPALLATRPTGLTLLAMSSIPALTTLNTSTPTFALPDKTKTSAVKTTSASDLGLMMTPTSGSLTTLPADLFPCASKSVTSSTRGDLADPTRVSAPLAVVMALATTPGLSTMLTAGSPLTLCADARTEKARVSHSETTPNWQPRCHKLPTST